MVKIRMDADESEEMDYYDVLPDDDKEQEEEQEEEHEEEQEEEHEEEQEEGEAEAEAEDREEDDSTPRVNEEVARAEERERRMRSVGAQWPLVGCERVAAIRKALEAAFAESQERWDELYSSRSHYDLRFAIVDALSKK
ncbi:unknown protein [Seminavis robusta]|uniref:Uncharacterized protein n=1 Tax=Seminavis robusta TaxID=568900 RepID=A0A9N8DKF8_9STRA|nr:unknown protein [Seminavis robusta]|eukprot:Sro177_g077810.1 n/a (139) ;mRNA; f:64718-65134